MAATRLFQPAAYKISDQYSFVGQEQDYYQFRPKWPKAFAVAALAKAGIYFSETGEWQGIGDRTAPVIVSIGSGAGSDAGAFLQAGCRVYGVEPNEDLRQLADGALAAKYPGQFVSINGNAHALNLPAGLKVDLIICAQALHTFSMGEDSKKFADARLHWETFLVDADKNRFSIWYYNLEPNAAIRTLDLRLKTASKTYAASLTTFFDAPSFEPLQFQPYIHSNDMSVSTAQYVDSKRLTLEDLKRWLKAYSFYPKDIHEEAAVMKTLCEWYDIYKNEAGEIELPYIGFISQGPLRHTPFFTFVRDNVTPSPISSSESSKASATEQPFWDTVVSLEMSYKKSGVNK